MPSQLTEFILFLPHCNQTWENPFFFFYQCLQALTMQLMRAGVISTSGIHNFISRCQWVLEKKPIGVTSFRYPNVKIPSVLFYKELLIWLCVSVLPRTSRWLWSSCWVSTSGEFILSRFSHSGGLYSARLRSATADERQALTASDSFLPKISI